MAAGAAAQTGAEVVLFDKNHKPGIKLALTGHGRCNLTHDEPIESFITRYFGGGRFLRQAFGRYFYPELVAFLGELGVATVCEADGRVFPSTGRAADIVQALYQWTKKLKVSTVLQTPVVGMALGEERVFGVRTAVDTIGAEAVVIAAGGSSYPITGSTGDGYALAESAGHRIIPPRPSLVPLVTGGNAARRLQGVSVQDVTLTARVGDQVIEQRRGDLLFTHYGLSGPAALNISRAVVSTRTEGRKVEIDIDFFPSEEDQEIEDRLQRLFNKHGKQQVSTILRNLLPQRLAELVAARASIREDAVGAQVAAEQRREVTSHIKRFHLTIVGDRGFEDAITTAGGVDTRQVDPRTMQSKLVRGLYFCGETLDIDGESGGYNLQAAFSTGWLAGTSAGSQT